MIEVRNLTKFYGSHKAVDNISFSVEEGEIVGFLGPNGAGKSTTLRILTCFLPATSGSASVAGFDVFTQSLEVRRRVGYLPESNPLYQEMRVREFLNFRGKLRGMERSAREAAIRRVADRVWLGDFIDRPIGQLSKGMKQRVGLADALLHDPKVLVLDEPTIGLDPTQIRETRKLISDLARRHTIILSSHILPEVEATCQRTIIIAGGRIRASGSMSEIRDRIKGASRVIAEIRGPKEDVARAIRQVNGVKNVEINPNEGWNHLRIETSEGRDVREEIASVAARHNWGLRDLRLETGGLEEFFIQITAEAAGSTGR
ncbi:MAG TPA: ATP-binding cassette domain-containing protein [Phycisphaerae bacterium]|nr:ATP-binding cassette domain-containing protein [Phycisphaerae bacterium]HRR83777.1 ATP-binding cassette domain-containing protein [Phycisphaerae bacterium]